MNASQLNLNCLSMQEEEAVVSEAAANVTLYGSARGGGGRGLGRAATRLVKGNVREAVQNNESSWWKSMNTISNFEMLSFSSESPSAKRGNNSFSIGGSWSQQGGASVNATFTRTW